MQENRTFGDRRRASEITSVTLTSFGASGLPRDRPPPGQSRRHIRPTHVVIRNRPRTQQIAADIFNEWRWAGIQWWSYQRLQWTVVALWATGNLTVASVDELRGHAALDDAVRALAKSRRGV